MPPRLSFWSICGKIGLGNVRTGNYWLKRYARLAAGLGVHFDVGSSEGERLLSAQNAEAVVFLQEQESTVVLRADPTASAVLEELAHALQAHRRRFLEFPPEEVEVRREIEAKECLLNKATYLQIPPGESDATRRLLESDRRKLAQIRRSG